MKATKTLVKQAIDNKNSHKGSSTPYKKTLKAFNLTSDPKLQKALEKIICTKDILSKYDLDLLAITANREVANTHTGNFKAIKKLGDQNLHQQLNVKLDEGQTLSLIL